MVFKLSVDYMHVEALTDHLRLAGHDAEIIPSVGCCVNGFWTTSNDVAFNIMESVFLDFCNTFQKVAA